MINFEKVMGLEIHIELNTKTKMFSPSPNVFNDIPNKNISPVDLGLPGALPTVNKEAIVSAIKLAKALKMEISDDVQFDRKHYLYPDLPKGYQITQFYNPIAKNGVLKLPSGLEVKIERIQLEEDTAKSNKADGVSMLDFNRAGVPLIEIITEPIFRRKRDVKEYIELLQILIKRLDISDARMEEGSFRVDLNLSIRPRGSKKLLNRVEIKNISTITNIMDASDYEYIDQIKKFLVGHYVTESTKRFDEDTKTTVLMRVKLGESDYKFIPDPNIPLIDLPKEVIDSIEIPSSPTEDFELLIKNGVSEEYASQIIIDIHLQNYYFEIINSKIIVDEKERTDKIEWNAVAKLFFAEIISLANAKNVHVTELKIPAKEIKDVIYSINDGFISGKQAKKIIPLLVGGEKTTSQIIKEKDLKLISDVDKLTKLVKNITRQHRDFVINNISRAERVEKFVIGELMKTTRGQANPVVSARIVKEVLRKNV